MSQWTIYDAPSDRDYQEQLNPSEPEEEENAVQLPKLPPTTSIPSGDSPADDQDCGY